MAGDGSSRGHLLSHRGRAVALGVGAVLVVAVAAHGEESRPTSNRQPATINDQPATGNQVAGQRVYIDPSTGRIGVPPSNVPAPQAGSAATAAPEQAAPEPLVQQAVQGPAGGVMVDLKGRFRREVRARTLPDGRVVTECVPAERP